MAKKYRRRRTWSDDEKAMICSQTRVPGVSVSQVARRYDVNANQVFKWLKDPKYADVAPPDEGPCFLPVEIVDDGTVIDAEVEADDAPCSQGRLEIALAGGHRLRVIGPYDAEALATLIRRLSP